MTVSGALQRSPLPAKMKDDRFRSFRRVPAYPTRAGCHEFRPQCGAPRHPSPRHQPAGVRRRPTCCCRRFSQFSEGPSTPDMREAMQLAHELDRTLPEPAGGLLRHD